MMMARYTGRLIAAPDSGSQTIDDSLSGPVTVSEFFDSDIGTIEDPLSFPWHLVSQQQWRQPVLVNLLDVTDLDQIALSQVLPALTPHDILLARPERHKWLTNDLSFPPSAIATERPDDEVRALNDRADAKLHTSLLREVLEPAIRSELEDARGSEAALAATVIGTDVEHDWFATLVPAPHLFLRAEIDALAPDSADLLIVSTKDAAPQHLPAILSAVRPGGVVILICSAQTMRGIEPSITAIVEAFRRKLDGAMLIDHVWGLHLQPGTETLGGILGVRPLGTRADRSGNE